MASTSAAAAAAINQNGEEVVELSQTKRASAAAPKRRKRPRRRRRSTAAEGEREMWLEVQQRYGRKRGHQNEMKEAVFEPATGRCTHPASYERMMARAIEAHLNRVLQPEPPADDLVVSSNWRCALCFGRSCEEEKGELFGPYFIHLSTNCQPPPQLLALPAAADEPSPQKQELPSTSQAIRRRIIFGANPPKIVDQNSSIGDSTMDVWLHGDCALWTPELFLMGGRLPTLQMHIQRYWKQKCLLCQVVGATIPLTVSMPLPSSPKAKKLLSSSIQQQEQERQFLHYRCAVENDYRLDPLTLVCRPPLPVMAKKNV